jgi:hypothetical protein
MGQLHALHRSITSAQPTGADARLDFGAHPHVLALIPVAGFFDNAFAAPVDQQISAIASIAEEVSRVSGEACVGADAPA